MTARFSHFAIYKITKPRLPPQWKSFFCNFLRKNLQDSPNRHTFAVLYFTITPQFRDTLPNFCSKTTRETAEKQEAETQAMDERQATAARHTQTATPQSQRAANP